MDRTALFDAVRPFAPGQRFSQQQVDTIDALADGFGLRRAGGVRRISDRGIALIQEFEGERLEAYPDPGTGGEPWTIGVGHTGGVKPGDRITREQSEAFLRKDLERFEAAVNRLAPKATQGQHDALVALAFNIGEGALAGSTLLKLHNAGDYGAAARQFGRWVNAGGKPMKGLIRRRDAEAALYSEGL
jgi:lysozyme